MTPNDVLCLAGVSDYIAKPPESVVLTAGPFRGAFLYPRASLSHNAEKGGYSVHLGVSVGVSEVHKGHGASNTNGLSPKCDSHYGDAHSLWLRSHLSAVFD